MRSEGNDPKNGEPAVGISLTTLLQHTNRFWSKISQPTTWQHWSIPHTFHPGSSWFLPVSSTKTSMEGMKLLRCYWHHWEFERRAEKDFRKWLPGMLPTPLQSLAEVYIFTRGLYWKKSSLNDELLSISQKYVKWFQRHFETTVHIIRSWIISRNKRK